jgi:hypothetical protein
MMAEQTEQTLDFSARYGVVGMPGIAFYLRGWVTEQVYEGDQLICDDEECDHSLSEMCWAEGDYSLVSSDSQVRAVMVGDDREHIVDIDDLTELGELDYCAECGQIGCAHDGRDRE